MTSATSGTQADGVPRRHRGVWRQAGAWVLFGLGLALVTAVALATSALTSDAFDACSAGSPPEYCEYPMLGGFFAAMPVAGVLSYVVGGVVGLLLLRRSAWSLAVPPTLALLACSAMVVPVAFL